MAQGDEPAVLYFSSELSSSSAGRAVAEHIGAHLGADPQGRAIPILKNTRSPAVVVAVPEPDEETTASIVQGLIELYRVGADRDELAT